MPFDLKKVLDERKGQNFTLHSKYVNPQLPRVLGTLEFDRFYVKGEGCYLIDDEGDRYLDFLSGFGVFALGRGIRPSCRRCTTPSTPTSRTSCRWTAPSSPVSWPSSSSARAHPGIERVFFTNSGAEAVESAIKFARAATKRTRILYCNHAFHGLTTGALALNGGQEFRGGFGPLLPGCDMIPFGDAAALARELRRGDVAAFIAEPIQGKGVNLAPDEYWPEAQSLCRRHKALMILDEVQAGLGRSGTFFCHEQFGITPDIITVSKALSGGYVPVGAMLCSAEVSDSVFSSMDRAVVHSSTFSTNQLAMVAGLATLAAFDDEDILDRVQRTGKAFTKALRAPGRTVRVPPRGAGEGPHDRAGVRRAHVTGSAPAVPDDRGPPPRPVLPDDRRPALPPPPHPDAGGGRQPERGQASPSAHRRRRRGRALHGRARRRADQRSSRAPA